MIMLGVRNGEKTLMVVLPREKNDAFWNFSQHLVRDTLNKCL